MKRFGRPPIHWAWVPAALFTSIVAWNRFGAAVTLLCVLGGLLLALYLEARARRKVKR
jgi:hypothetical protein